MRPMPDETIVIARVGVPGPGLSPWKSPSPAAARVLKGAYTYPGWEVLLLRSLSEELHTFRESLLP